MWVVLCEKIMVSAIFEALKVERRVSCVSFHIFSVSLVLASAAWGDRSGHDSACFKVPLCAVDGLQVRKKMSDQKASSVAVFVGVRAEATCARGPILVGRYLVVK